MVENKVPSLITALRNDAKKFSWHETEKRASTKNVGCTRRRRNGHSKAGGAAEMPTLYIVVNVVHMLLV